MTRRRRLSSGLLAACVALAALPSLASAAAPTDPQAAAQQPLRIMRVGEALDLIARPLADVPVLVADTGLDLSNPDIQPRLFSLPAPVEVPDPDGGPSHTVAAGAPGWDFIGSAGVPGATLRPDGDPHDPEGGSGHGTRVAGLLGAAWNNGEGGAGVAPNARFLALRTCWDDDQCYQYVQSAAIDWAADRGVRVASFSWLSGALEDGLSASIVDHPNTLFVTIPSGNGGAFDADGGNPQPCGLDAANVLCVSTSAPDDGLDCGAFGPSSVDVAVPTQNSVTTNNGVVSGNPAFVPTTCATSFAAPTAAGVATILFGIDPSASAAAVRDAIVDSARPVAAWQGRSTSGGIVDAAAAVSLFQQRRGIAPATPDAGGPDPGAGDPSGSDPSVGDPGGSDPSRSDPRALDPSAPDPSMSAGVTPAPRTPSRPSSRAPDSTRPQLNVVRRGRSLNVTVSERATVTLTIERARSGRRSSGACRRPSARLRRAPRCTRWEGVTVVRQSNVPGGVARTLKLPLVAGRRRALPAGSYRGVLVATDTAGRPSVARTFTYEIHERR